MVDKTPAALISGTPSDTSVIHSSEDGLTDNSKKHNERDISRLQGTAPDYSASKTYALNDLVTESGNTFQNIIAISTPEAFNATKWRSFGDVVGGTGTYADNEIPRYSGTTGKLFDVPGSVLAPTIGDQGQFINVGGILMKTRTTTPSTTTHYLQTVNDNVRINVGLDNTKVFHIEFLENTRYTFSNTQANFLGQNIINVGFLELNATNPATVGEIRLGNTETISWRNPGNDADTFFRVNSNNEFTFNPDGAASFRIGDFGADLLGNTLLNVQTYESNAITPATTGEIRLGNTEQIGWRNNAEDGNAELRFNSGDQFSFDIVGAAKFRIGINDIDFLTTPLLLTEISTPTTPLANKAKIYVKENNSVADLFLLDENGNEKNFVTTSADTIYVTSQADLEASILGTNLEVPDNTNVSIKVLNDFTLDKPIKLGLNSRLSMFADGLKKIVFFDPTISTDAFFENVDNADAFTEIILNDIQFEDVPGTSQFFNLFRTGSGITLGIQTNNIRIVGFNDIGLLSEVGILVFDCTFSGYNFGFTVDGDGQALFRSSSFIPNATVNLTSITVTADNPVNVVNCLITNAAAGQSVIFIEPGNAIPVDIRDCVVFAGTELFQQGTDITVDSAALGSGGAGFTNFTTAAPHGFVVGQATTNSTFADSAYNGTFIVVSLPSATIYEVAATFTLTGAGITNEESLQSTDLIVDSRGNSGFKDSIAVAEITNAVTLIVDNSGGGFVAIEDITPALNDFTNNDITERFTVNTDTGLVTYVGLEPLSCIISFQVRLTLASGGAQTITVSLFQNATQATKTDVSIIAGSSPGSVALYTGGLFDVNTNDTFQLFLNNTTNTNNTLADDFTLTVREA